MYFSKAMWINLSAMALIAAGVVFESGYSQLLLFTGLFALSGALTNRLAVHMLFERVPLAYGSGVIELQFEPFKAAIKSMMMTQFFNPEQIEGFVARERQKIDLLPVVEASDFSAAFDALVESVMESSFGNMLGMFGGKAALEGLREPFEEKLKKAVSVIIRSEAFEAQVSQQLERSGVAEELGTAIEGVIERRLDAMTPQMVKELVQSLIREHLDWLVVWGGLFGGVIGLISTYTLL